MDQKVQRVGVPMTAGGRRSMPGGQPSGCHFLEIQQSNSFFFPENSWSKKMDTTNKSRDFYHHFFCKKACQKIEDGLVDLWNQRKLKRIRVLKTLMGWSDLKDGWFAEEFPELFLPAPTGRWTVMPVLILKPRKIVTNHWFLDWAFNDLSQSQRNTMVRWCRPGRKQSSDAFVSWRI